MMKVRIDTDTGTEERDLELAPDKLTLRESVRLEKILGSELVEKLMGNELDPTEFARPSIIQAMIYVKLKTEIPDLDIDGFDIDLEELFDQLTEEGEVEASPKLREASSG